MLCTGGGHGNRCNRVYFRSKCPQPASAGGSGQRLRPGQPVLQRLPAQGQGAPRHRRPTGDHGSLGRRKEQKQPIYAGTLIGSSSLDFEDAGEEERLFYDAISERYFQATISQVLQAEYHLNRNFALGGGFITLNQFYEFLGIEPVPGGDEVGWMVSDGLYWVDFDHQKTVVDDGLNGEVECYIIDAPLPAGKRA